MAGRCAASDVQQRDELTGVGQPVADEAVMGQRFVSLSSGRASVLAGFVDRVVCISLRGVALASRWRLRNQGRVY